jgi:hypothetical protein
MLYTKDSVTTTRSIVYLVHEADIVTITLSPLRNLKKSDLKDQNQTPPSRFETVFVWGYTCVYLYITLNLHISHGKISYLYVSIVTPLSGEASCFG